jgi:O-antigen/teichoic acid export membrane protein
VGQLVGALFTTGLIQLANLASGMLAAHILLPAGRGELAAALLWPTLVSYIGTLSLHDAALYLTAGRRVPAEQVFATGTALILAAAAVALLAGWTLVLPLAYGSENWTTRDAASLVLMIVPAQMICVFLLELLRGHLRLATWNVLRVLPGITYVAGILVMVGMGEGTVQGFACAFVASTWVTAGVTIGLILRESWARWRPSRAAAAALLSFALKVHAGYMVSQVNSRLDQILLIAWLDPAPLGFYVASMSLSLAVQMVGGSIVMVAVPRLAAVADPDERRVAFGRYFRLLVAFMVTGGLALFLLSPWIVPLLFGPAFLPVVRLIGVLLIGVVALSLRDLMLGGLKAFDSPLAPGVVEVAILALNVVALTVLVRAYGVTGAALGYAVVQCAALVLTTGLLRWRAGVTWRHLLIPTTEDVRQATAALGRLRELSRRGAPG